ncbi:MAG: transcription antitermination factor NusB [Clostridia bacterium]|nr:transcription antitermination factor NusB [Clostridia bacterium]MBQ3553221.1 transcription antitermination factor NusB [Clostridia bacterium]
MTRKEARDNGFKIVFEYEFQKTSAKELLDLFYTLNPEESAQTDYLNRLVETTLGNLDEIDGFISKYAKDWSISRISKVSLASLRIGLCEMLYDEEIADSIAINEAVELAKIYEGEKAGAFVNGILSSVYKSRQ